MTLFVVSVTLALSISAFCSLLEATLLSFTPAQVADLSARQPRLGAIWQRFKANIERPIAVILLINTAAHTIGATLAGAQFEAAFGPEGLIWFSLAFTYVMLQFTEILPKTLGVLHNRRLAPLIVLPLEFLVRLLSPVLAVIHFINRPFEGRRAATHAPAPLEEIAALAGLARLSRFINPHQERVIKGAAQLADRTVDDVMVPVEQITYLRAAQPAREALETAYNDPHTRFPVVEDDDIDRVVGYVNLKELVYLLHASPSETSMRSIIRPVHFVRVDLPANELMKVFIERHEHMAIVQDSDGRTVGLATFEDVVEELVGDLEDEFDRLPRHLHQLSGGVWLAGGGLPVAELAARSGIALPDTHGSTSAYVIRALGRTPRPNEVVTVDGAEFAVKRLRRGGVFEVALTRAARTVRATA